MIELFYFGLLLQGLLMTVDEFFFHKRRHMPKWERVGHPVDTFFFLFAFVLLYLQGSNLISISAAILSTLIIIKDEAVHAKVAQGGEHFLHALLFILHPIVLYLGHMSVGLWGLEVIAILFMYLTYQIIYWNFYAKQPISS